MLKIAFLCSGGGGNLKFVGQAIYQGWLRDAQVCGVLSDRECAADTFARAQGWSAEVMDFSEAGQPQVIEKLLALQPDVTVTTVHKILTPQFVDTFRGKLLNLHYSLLPAFGGAIGERPVQQALAFGAKFIGVTVHHVDEQVDMGRPIVQAMMATPQNPAVDALMHVLFRSGCISLLHAVATLSVDSAKQPGRARSSMTQMGHTVFFSPAVVIEPILEHDSGWAFLN